MLGDIGLGDMGIQSPRCLVIGPAADLHDDLLRDAQVVGQRYEAVPQTVDAYGGQFVLFA